MSNSSYARSEASRLGRKTRLSQPTECDTISEVESNWAGIGTCFGRRGRPGVQTHAFQPRPPIPPKTASGFRSGVRPQNSPRMYRHLPPDTEKRIREWDAQIPPLHEQTPPDVRSESDAQTMWDASSIGETFARRSEGPNESKLPKVYYRIYARNFYHPLVAKHPIHLDDPGLTHSNLTWVAPPLTAGRVSSFICGREGLPLKGATLHLSQFGKALADGAPIAQALNKTSAERPICLVADINQERTTSYKSHLPDTKTSAAFAQPKGPGLANLTKVYYRLNDSSGLPLASDRPIFEDDNSLGFVNLEWVTPPVNVDNIRAFICGHEQLHKSRGTLYISQKHVEPADLRAPWFMLAATEQPPTNPKHPLRMVVTLAPGGRDASALSKWRASPSEALKHALHRSWLLVGASARKFRGLFHDDATVVSRPNKIRRKKAAMAAKW